MKMKFYCLLLMLFASFAAWSQKTVTGKVTKEDGSPLPGATVTVKGTKTSVSSKADGTFSIQVPSNTSKLVVSFVGNAQQEITVGTQTNIAVSMKEESSSLTDVVVIGYATVKKKDVLSSVSSIGARDLKDIPINNPAEALNGRLAGVTATTAEGSPDADVRVRVRGGISITGDNSPLYVVDGVVLENAFNTLSPQDIQSIDVLKDMAATAIYGSRGANGVIVITTKSGKPGKMRVSYNGLFGIKKIRNTLDVMDPYGFVTYAYERARGSSTDSSTFAKNYGTTWDTLKNYKNVPFVNWQDEVMGITGYTQTHNVTMNGGNKKMTYNFSYTRNNDKAIVLNSKYTRNLFNLKGDYKITKNVKIAVGGRLNNQDVYGAGVSAENGTSFNRLRNAVKYRPFLSNGQDIDEPDPFADPNVGNGLSLTNPVSLADAEYRKKNTNAYNANASITINLTKRITFKSTVGFDHSKLIDKQWSDSITPIATTQGARKPIIALDTTTKKGFTNSNVLTYSLKNWKKVHDFDFLIGEETLQNDFDSYGVTVKELTVGQSGYPNKAFENRSSGTLIGVRRHNQTRATLFSFFGRINYSYKDKYLLSANFRADGSSKFAPGRQWGYFPAGSIAWRLKKEKFLEDVDWINDLKLRFGYGESGNNRIGDYQFLTTFNYGTFYYGINGQLVQAASSATLVNEKLKWESNVSRNLGLDIALFNNKIDFSMDVYKNSSKDLLLLVPIASTFGYSTQQQNVGETTNKGIEFQLATTILKKRNNLTWNASYNMSFNKSTVKSLGYQTQFFPGASWGVSGQPADFITRIGEPVGSMYGWVNDGFYHVEDFNYDAATTMYSLKTGVADMEKITGNVVPGAIKFKDISGPNGVPDGIVDDLDRTIIGNPTPKFSGGLNQQFTYKGWDASVFVNFSYGNDIYNANKIELTNAYSANSNMLALMNDRWRITDDNGNTLQYTRNVVVNGVTRVFAIGAPPAQLAALNANAKIWSPIKGTGAFYPNSWAIEDGSFLRLNNVTIGYSFPLKTLVKMRMSKLRLYVTGNNLAVITNYSGYDPEVSVRNSPLTPGLDYSSYPKSRSFIIGANVTF